MVTFLSRLLKAGTLAGVCLGIKAQKIDQARFIELKKREHAVPAHVGYKIHRALDTYKHAHGKAVHQDTTSSFERQLLATCSYVPLWVWQLIGLLVWMGAVGALVTKKYRLTCLLISLSVGVSVPIILLGRYKARRWAVVTAQSAELYLGPDSTYPVKSALDYLADVRIIKERPVDGQKQAHIWYYVDTHVGKGWMQAQALALTGT